MLNVKKLQQWSDEAFNAGKEIEAMKRVTLHCNASSLLVPIFVYKLDSFWLILWQ